MIAGITMLMIMIGGSIMIGGPIKFPWSHGPFFSMCLLIQSPQMDLL